MVPKSHTSDMRWRFSQGAMDYDTLKSSILSYTQHARFESSYGKGDTDMQVDAFGYAKSDDWSDWISSLTLARSPPSTRASRRV